MAERINQDIDEDFNQKEREDEMRALHIQSHMSESGAYGVSYPAAASELARKRQEQLLLALDREDVDQRYRDPRDVQPFEREEAEGNKNYSNLEFGNSIFKNRPFSSENKYGHIRRNQPRVTVNTNG